MANTARLGAVIFTRDKNRLAQFYEAVTGLKVSARDDGSRNTIQFREVAP